jgi:hypothetical protein
MSQSPTIAYPGGKGRLAQEIVSFLPKSGRVYCEPFCGRGNLFWSAASSGLNYEKWWLNDLKTMPFFRAIREIGHVVEVPERSRAEFERQRAASKRGDPTALLLEPILSFRAGGYRSGFQSDNKGGVSPSGYQQTLRECHRIIGETKPRLTGLDWRQLNLEKLTEDDVVMLDPPYPNTDVRSFSPKTIDYNDLVDTLLRARYRWFLCGYAHAALERLGEPFWANDNVRFLYFDGKEERRTECLVRFR